MKQLDRAPLSGFLVTGMSRETSAPREAPPPRGVHAAHGDADL
jgi:hypothetical protein